MDFDFTDKNLDDELNEIRKNMANLFRSLFESTDFSDEACNLSGKEISDLIRYHFTQQELDMRESRNDIINYDDVINLKVSLGLYESGKISFDEMLEII
ncbi:MAG: hypothetical protein ACOC1O_01555 [bacterium]